MSNFKLPIGLAQKTVESFVNALIGESLKDFSLTISKEVETTLNLFIEKDSPVIDLTKINFDLLMVAVKNKFIETAKNMKISFENVADVIKNQED